MCIFHASVTLEHAVRRGKTFNTTGQYTISSMVSRNDVLSKILHKHSWTSDWQLVSISSWNYLLSGNMPSHGPIMTNIYDATVQCHYATMSQFKRWLRAQIIRTHQSPADWPSVQWGMWLQYTQDQGCRKTGSYRISSIWISQTRIPAWDLHSK